MTHPTLRDFTFTLRMAGPADIPTLQEVEYEAGGRFIPTRLIATPDHRPEPIPVSAYRDSVEAGLLLMAVGRDDRAIGYALCRDEPPDLLLEQLSVTERLGCRGVGSALLAGVESLARARDRAGVVLTTFRDLAWNGPFYRRRGYREIPRARWTEWQRAIARSHAEIMPGDLRCFMRKPVAKGGLFRRFQTEHRP